VSADPAWSSPAALLFMRHILCWDAAKVLQEGLDNCQIVDAYFPLERLRARKTRAELAQLQTASERVLASMLAVFNGCALGQTKNEIVDRLRREEVERGPTFEYCLISARHEP
jgi:Xaa-Pro aminopeptidase